MDDQHNLTDTQRDFIIETLSHVLDDKEIMVWALEAYLPTFEDSELIIMAENGDIEWRGE